MQKITIVPEELKLQLLHMIASHHGKQEYGALVVPKTLEKEEAHLHGVLLLFFLLSDSWVRVRIFISSHLEWKLFGNSVAGFSFSWSMIAMMVGTLISSVQFDSGRSGKFRFLQKHILTV